MSALIPFVAVAMVVSWVTYIALTVLAITGGEAAKLLAWVVITPFLFAFQWLGFQALERYTTF